MNLRFQPAADRVGRMIRQQRSMRSIMTRAQFIAFVAPLIAEDVERTSYDVVPCDCGDLNCHGWRVVEREPATP